jgi:aminoglycoside phosphotransferase (APT) family kinase protein
VSGGNLSVVIDFGCAAVGDPACDLVIAWTFLDGKSREAFRSAVAMDESTWARARGWALWKALIMLAQFTDGQPRQQVMHRRVIDNVLAEHQRLG